MTLNMAPVDIADLVREAASSAHQRASRELQFDLDFPSHSVMVNADTHRLAQALDNLLSNAVKFTPSAGHISLKLTELDQVVRIEVRDTGLGIGEDDLRRVFDRFWRSDRAVAEMVPGTGIGLAVSKAIVERHGGQLSATSTLGEGSCFVIALPRAGEASAA